MARSRVLRWLFLPVWTASPPVREEWPCPACGRTVWRLNPALKGIWFVPSELELLARCARQHGAHGRRGEPLPADDGTWSPAVALAELAGLPSADRRIPVVALDGGGFVALLPPAGLLLLPAGDGFDVHALDELMPSDLVGRPAVRGRRLGHVAAEDVAVAQGSIDAADLSAALPAGEAQAGSVTPSSAALASTSSGKRFRTR